MDTYQPIYDAVKSKLSNCDVGRAVQESVDHQLGGIGPQLSNAIQSVELEYIRPSVLYRPTVVRDGNKWSALYGENLMEGVCGFGDSPELAMRDFDANWNQKITTHTRN